MNNPIQFFDGHNDFLLRLLKSPAPREETWLGTGKKGHLDLARMKQVGFAGGLFAIFVPPAAGGPPPDFKALMANPPHDLPMPPGDDHVGLVPDFDGCTVPGLIADVTGVQGLFRALANHGYDTLLLTKLASGNWLNCLDRCVKMKSKAALRPPPPALQKTDRRSV